MLITLPDSAAFTCFVGLFIFMDMKNIKWFHPENDRPILDNQDSALEVIMAYESSKDRFETIQAVYCKGEFYLASEFGEWDAEAGKATHRVYAWCYLPEYP